MTEHDSLIDISLAALKGYFLKIVKNKSPNIRKPLFYDIYWDGIVSSFPWDREDIGGKPDGGECYGNAIYNDHQFHYGYLVYTAALIAHMDAGFVNEPGVKDFINTLVRDYASPVDDQYFPFSRSFDWWHGHSWAAGTKGSSDGKDLESTSEDAMAHLAVKLWGKVIGDKSMEARGNLQLAVLKRSINSYFLWESGNNIQNATKLTPFKSSGVVSSSNAQRPDSLTPTAVRK
jgi:endo-1,3(4)-beta-glucanase